MKNLVEETRQSLELLPQYPNLSEEIKSQIHSCEQSLTSLQRKVGNLQHAQKTVPDSKSNFMSRLRQLDDEFSSCTSKVNVKAILDVIQVSFA